MKYLLPFINKQVVHFVKSKSKFVLYCEHLTGEICKTVNLLVNIF